MQHLFFTIHSTAKIYHYVKCTLNRIRVIVIAKTLIHKMSDNVFWQEQLSVLKIKGMKR